MAQVGLLRLLLCHRGIALALPSEIATKGGPQLLSERFQGRGGIMAAKPAALRSRSEKRDTKTFGPDSLFPGTGPRATSVGR